MWIATVDPGKNNFAFSIEEIDENALVTLKKKLPPKNQRVDIYGELIDVYKNALTELYKASKTILFKTVNISLNKKTLDQNVFMELTRVLDEHRFYWDKCAFIIIEQQMSFGKNINVMALKIAQHVYSYMIFQYHSFKSVYYFPAYNKTQLLGAPKKLTKPQRKKWAVEKATEVWTLRKDNEALERLKSYKKKDDVSDCLIMSLAFMVYHLLDEKDL
jgi:hypothetical protein